MVYVMLRGRWWDIIVLNVHAPTGDKIDYVKDSYYKKLELIFDKFPKHHKKNLLNFSAKVDREDHYKDQGIGWIKLKRILAL
jgi:hypothetical protein